MDGSGALVDGSGGLVAVRAPADGPPARVYGLTWISPMPEPRPAQWAVDCPD